MSMRKSTLTISKKNESTNLDDSMRLWYENQKLTKGKKIILLLSSYMSENNGNHLWVHEWIYVSYFGSNKTQKK